MVTVCRAQGVSLQDEGGVAGLSEAHRDAVEAREDFWSMSGEFIHRHQVMPREHVVCSERVIIPNSVKID